MKDLYTENYKTLMKEIEKGTKNGKIYCTHRLEELILLKCPYYPKQWMYRLNTNLSKFQWHFHRPRTNNFKFCMANQNILKSQNNLEKEEQSWRYHTPWFQSLLQSYIHQNIMVLAQKQTHRSLEQNWEPRNKPTHI